MLLFPDGKNVQNAPNHQPVHQFCIPLFIGSRPWISCEPYWTPHPWHLKFLPSGNHVRRRWWRGTCEWIVHRDVDVKNPQIRFGPFFAIAMCSPKYIDFMKNIEVNC